MTVDSPHVLNHGTRIHNFTCLLLYSDVYLLEGCEDKIKTDFQESLQKVRQELIEDMNHFQDYQMELL